MPTKWYTWIHLMPGAVMTSYPLTMTTTTTTTRLSSLQNYPQNDDDFLSVNVCDEQKRQSRTENWRLFHSSFAHIRGRQAHSCGARKSQPKFMYVFQEYFRLSHRVLLIQCKHSVNISRAIGIISDNMSSTIMHEGNECYTLKHTEFGWCVQ